MLDAMLVQLGADDTELTGGIAAAGAQIHLTGHKVKVDPAAVLSRQDTLRTKYHAIGAQIQLLQSIPHKVHGELLVGLGTPGCEDLIGMVMMVVMVVTTAGAVLIVVVVMMVVIMIVMMILVVMIVMVMVFMLMVMIMFVVMFMIMVVATAGAMFIVGLVMVVLRSLHLRNDLSNGCAAFHGYLQLRTGQFSQRGRDNGSIGIMLFEHLHSGIQLLLRYRIGTGQNDTTCGFNLIVIKFAEVLHVDLYLVCIHNRNGTAQLHILAGNLLHRADHIGELANAGGLNDNAVRMILVNDLGQRTAEVANQAAANTAGVHLSDVDARLLQEAAVNTDLAKLILDQHQAFALVAFGDHLLDQCGLTGTQKTGVNINFCHINHLSFKQKIQLLSVFPLRLHFYLTNIIPRKF